MGYLTDKAKEMIEDPDAKESTPPEAGWKDVITAIVNGAGVGLLLGALLGLSISPVVSGVIGTLSGLLAVLLGTSEKYMGRLKSIRIGVFGFFCVAGILLGIHIRTNNATMPDREKMMLDYRRVGFTKQEALDFIAFREFGLVPAGWKGGPAPQEAAPGKVGNPSADTSGKGNEAGNTTAKLADQSGKTMGQPSGGGAVEHKPSGAGTGSPQARVFANAGATGAERQSVLYSSEISSTGCYFISMADSTQPIAEIRDKFERAGGTWKEMAGGLGEGLPEKIYIRALLTMRECFCHPGQAETVKIELNEQIKKIHNGLALNEIIKILSQQGGNWTTIVGKVGKNIPVEYQKQVYLTLIKIFKS